MTLFKWQEEILEQGGELYRVGGIVRDQLLGATDDIQDTDFLVRAIPPEKLEETLRKFGKLVLVGKSFGAYKFIPTGAGEVFDIVFPRTERSMGPGHKEFDVHWDWQLEVEDDLRRRDFTINAIARDVRDGSFIDPLDGRRDLERRVLKMIFPEALTEDPLRVLRGIRFAFRFGLKIEKKTKEAMVRAVPLLGTLSTERVQDELTKLLTQCERPSEAFLTLRETGALAVILPELDQCAGVSQNEFHPDDVFVHSIKTCDVAPRDNLVVRWAALLHDVGKVEKKQVVADEKLGERVVFYGHQAVSAQVAKAVLRRLRYRNAFVNKVVSLVEHHMFDYEPEWKDSTVRRFVKRVGAGNLEDLFLLREADAGSRGADERAANIDEIRARVESELSARHALGIADLEVNGNDVIRVCGVKPGPTVGEILAQILEMVLEDPGKNEKTTLLEWLKEARGRQKNRKPQ